eukprot:CAMPEP_0182906070 /NCGR_PEP_ID=MMETSP0034_2-20130328/33449_1 /TAXON_ID=156128 /ORGANISM="Nephroselmis pyriformis, Strain CCMP717" /LENGTH=33 /DNA_ID= /DNA_START= /DNA_END= /DNA_ORIENTATION=
MKKVPYSWCNPQDYYDVLGVDFEATDDEIRKAY